MHNAQRAPLPKIIQRVSERASNHGLLHSRAPVLSPCVTVTFNWLYSLLPDHQEHFGDGSLYQLYWSLKAKSTGLKTYRVGRALLINVVLLWCMIRYWFAFNCPPQISYCFLEGTWKVQFPGGPCTFLKCPGELRSPPGKDFLLWILNPTREHEPSLGLLGIHHTQPHGFLSCDPKSDIVRNNKDMKEAGIFKDMAWSTPNYVHLSAEKLLSWQLQALREVSQSVPPCPVSLLCH